MQAKAARPGDPASAATILGAQPARCKAAYIGNTPWPHGQLPPRTRTRRATLTPRADLPDYGCLMSTAVYERERRSARVFMRIRVVLAGKNQQGRRFRAKTETIVINAHGGLVYLDQDLEMGALLILTNTFSQEEQECRIVYLGDDSDKGRRVGLEFVTPAPRFWGVELAQPDWVAAQQNSAQKN
jgi:hypothetical protein